MDQQTAAQRQMNARAALEQAVVYWSTRQPGGKATAAAEDVVRVADQFADFLDGRA